VSLPAFAECKKFGFTVNDYGKDGPTKDAKSLLDKLIATKMTEKGVKDFHTGKKNVSCELFLNFIVFDEHTCTAEATVCWGGSALPNSEQSAAAEDVPETKKSAETAEHKATKKKDVAKKIGSAGEKRKTAALRIPDPKKPAEHAAATAEQQPAVSSTAAESSTSNSAASESPATEAATSTPEPSASKQVETGSLSEPAKKAVKHHRAEPATSTEGEAAPAEPAANGAGYPTPEPPEDGQ
jgi:hypothetical protein